MEFVSSRNDLLRELALVQGVVERKSTIPVLAFALIENASDDYVRVRATDLEVSLETLCPAKTVRKGALLVPAKRLFEIIRIFPDADVTFSKQENDWVKITCEDVEFKLPAQDAQNFPRTPSVDGKMSAVDCLVMRSLIGKVVFAITQEESRYALGGADFRLDKDRLRMVATDGHRLAFVERTLDAHEGEAQQALIPKKALHELERLLVDSEGVVQFARDENHLFFKTGNRQLVSRTLSGKFPNYELVMPQENNIKTRVSKDRLIQAIRRVSLVSDEKSRSVRMSLAAGRLDLSAQSPEAGEARDSFVIEYGAEPMTIAFNASYLLDFLSAADGDLISIELKDEQSQALLRPVDVENVEYKYVVMPMRV